MARKFFALENADVVESTEAGLDGAEVLEMQDGIQEAQVEAAEVDEIATAIEDAEVAAGNMEEAAEVLEGGVESGEGVSEETAQAVDIAVEAALNMLGASHRGSNLMPSLESWGSGHSRLASTKLALEGVSDKIKEIWKKIVEFVKTIAQKVIDFFAKFFDNTERLKKAAAKMRAKVNEAGAGSKVKDKEIKNGSVTKAFNNGEGKSDYSTAVAILETHTGAAKSASTTVKSLRAIIDSLSSVKNMESIGGKLQDITKQATGSGGELFEEGRKRGHRSSPMLGGRRIEIGVEIGEATRQADRTADASLTYFMNTIEPEKKSTKEASTLTPSQCLDLIKKVEELATATEEYKKIKSDVQDMTKATAKLADAMIKASDEQGSAAGIRKFVSSMASTVSRYVTMLPAWNVSAGNAALSYVSSSISAWESTSKEKKD